jgi:zinc protease
MLDRKLAPSFSISRSIDLPSAKKLGVSDQFDTYYFNQVRQALIKVDIVYKAAKWQEPSSGVSHFTSQLIEKGTSTKTSYDIAGTFDQYGSHVEISPGFDYTTISLYCLSNKIKDVLPLFLEILLTPSFPENELILAKDIFSQNLKINNEKNSYVASKLIRKNIFGEAHPYGSSVEKEDLEKISRSSLLSFFENHFTPFEIYITGQIEDAGLSFLTNQLKELNFRKSKKESKEHNIQSGEHEKYVQKKESIQTSLRLGKRMINRNDKDYYEFLLLNHILGGYFGSRLMKNIREEKGLTYGIYSSVNSLLNDSFFVIGADVNKQNQDITMLEIHAELKKLREKKIGEEELEIAKSHFLGSIQLDMANPFSVMEKIKNINLNRLNPTYYRDMFARINETNPTKLNQVANRYLTGEDLFVVKVG